MKATMSLAAVALSCGCLFLKMDDPLVGNDRDSHGCIGSAGYTWSVLKNECIRIFEAGVPFDAYGSNQDITLSAFVVLSKDRRTAELFLPRGSRGGILLERKNAALLENAAEQVKITSSGEDCYILVQGERVFSQKRSKAGL